MDFSARSLTQKHTKNNESQQAWRYFWLAISIVVIYSTLHICARLLASPNLGEDDPLINVYTQYLSFGYDRNEPPLFTWLIYAVQLFTGPNLISFQLVKYAMFTATAGVLFWCAYAVTRNPVWSLVTAEAMTLIYHVGWRFHEGFTGLIPAMLCSVLSFLFILRIVEHRRIRDYIGLGLACGAGLLSQYSFAIGIGAFLIAAFIVKEVRVRLYGMYFLISACICMLIIAPHIAWIASDPQHLNYFTSIHTVFTHPHPSINLWRVVKKTLAAPFVFYWSLLLFLLLASWKRIAEYYATPSMVEISWEGKPLLQFIGWYFIAVHGLLMVAGIAISHVTYAYHDLLAVMLPTLVLLFALLFQLQPSTAEIQRWTLISLIILSLAFAGRAANMFIMEPFCNLCRWGIPYDQLAQKLRSTGFKKGTIVGLEVDLAGNLRTYFPASQISHRGLATLGAAWSQSLSGRPYVVVWQVGGKHGIRDTRETMRKRLNAAGLTQPIQILKAPWRHVLRDAGYRHTEWNYIVSLAPG
ncbi:MAG: glycosyltransferase family 39 protein [Pseudomonadota bacterium]